MTTSADRVRTRTPTGVPGHACAGHAGVDEAGRGPLAGPVVAAAVVLDPARPIAGLADSKKLTARARERLAEQVRADALAWAVAWADPAEIDALNILQASLLAMHRALLGLGPRPARVLVDGVHAPRVPWPGIDVAARPGADGSDAAVGAASILAKVHRDAWMVAADARFPGWGFAGHKGYPTRAHATALAELGPSPIHRFSFAPVRNAARVA